MRRALTYPLRRSPRLVVVALAGTGVLVLLIAAANAYLLLSTDGEATAQVAEVPRTEVAIVPGAGVNPNGTMSTMLADRVEQAVRLWRRSIFGVRRAVVVTQGFHMARALYLADEAGIDATGLTADLHPYGFQGAKSNVREVLSRVKAIADVTLEAPAMAGPKIPIATSDGRESWGPEPPVGTPAAGSPGD
jgi:vancomycin permeability regulator SanA